jgi:diguanylate cyclase (GGDEF)-like protein/putative nucleotidyltransferase with HDIG domain
MYWRDLPFKCRVYLTFVCALAVPLAVISLHKGGEYGVIWVLFTLASLFVATINLHLPQVPSIVISMGDVFTILALIHFGEGPALVSYWTNIVATALARHFKHVRKIAIHRLVFNLSCCAVSIFTMSRIYTVTFADKMQDPARILVGLTAIAVVWFFINTGSISLAISLSTGESFLSTWKEGLGLYLLNFFGSAAAAGLISLFYQRAGFSIFLLCLPIAVVLYQLYNFYIDKYQQAKSHISELNKLYLQTIEALANAVDAKDRYTHGHIRRVQAYALALAKHMGIVDEPELMGIKAGALLHDIGKIAIPEYILNKPTVLTEGEYEKMKIHPSVGASMLSDIEFPYPVIPLVKSHHERWDGNGYPEGLKGEEIPLSARILSLVDCYDALTTNRPYRSPMSSEQIIELFRKESGRAYDPDVVETFIRNIDEISSAAASVRVSESDLWGIKQPSSGNVTRQLERVQLTSNYGRALATSGEAQRELYSMFEFARADLQFLTPKDVFILVESKLSRLIKFDAAAFYVAQLTEGTVVAEHVTPGENLAGLTLSLEQKLTGWVAANNQPLCNLPPFPDFLHCGEPKPHFELSAIVPLNRHGVVLGAISLYRKQRIKFTDEEFRHLELIAGQTAITLSKCSPSDDAPLFDSNTGIPNALQLYLIFDQISTDATRYGYPLALFAIKFDDAKNVRRRWGKLSGEESVRAATRYLTAELRETDLLVRSGPDEFLILSPRINHEQAEALKSRVQDGLDHFGFVVRSDSEITMQAAIGIANFPQDGTDLEVLLAVAEWRAQEDHALRQAVKSHTRRIKP